MWSNEWATHYPPAGLPAGGDDCPKASPILWSIVPGVRLDAPAGSPGPDLGAAGRLPFTDPGVVDRLRG